jgi:PTS system fructose-specific IIC component
MIPFVTAGGILIAIGFMVSGDPAGFTSISVDNALSGALGDGTSIDMKLRVGALIFQLGAGLFGFLLPVLGGYIAFGIADRPGIVPGFLAGALAGTVGAGFLGAMVGGLLAGYVANYIAGWSVPAAIRSIMPIVVNPLLSSIVVGLGMIFVVRTVVKPVNTGLTNWLNGLSGGNLILLGVIIGLMMAFDMGGPLNKVAYTFGTAGIVEAAKAGITPDGKNTPAYVVMAAVMAAGMTPPLGLALATVLRKSLFSEAEIENGKAAWVLGASFITEGAIPFAVVDPLRVIPSIMVGSAAAGATVAALGATLNAPHGGIWVLPLIGNPLAFVAAVVVGTLITTAVVVTAKGIGQKANA